MDVTALRGVHRALSGYGWVFLGHFWSIWFVQSRKIPCDRHSGCDIGSRKGEKNVLPPPTPKIVFSGHGDPIVTRLVLAKA